MSHEHASRGSSAEQETALADVSPGGADKNTKTPINVVLMWHMHQPHYQDLQSGEFALPWTYLHATKDYSDMAYALEQDPDARAVVNFTPVLLHQLQEYDRQLAQYFASGELPKDPLLAALACESPPEGRPRRQLIAQCLRANRKNLIDRFPAFSKLVALAEGLQHNAIHDAYLTDQFLFDLLSWYHLAWLGESVRLKDTVVKKLIEQERGYSLYDRRDLLKVIHREVAAIIPRYRKLQDIGRIELSFTPESHPIVPLLFDFHSAVESLPHTTVPADNYPGGAERANWHVQRGIETFNECFGRNPVGCWPSEGSVCTRTLALLQEHGIQWAASGGGVLGKSLAAGEQSQHCIHHPYRLKDQDIVCFYRDDNLSDLIGFTYSDWNAIDAVNNLIHHIENIRHACNQTPDAIVPIILDGENCWEYYAQNGYFFLDALYQKLADHPLINLTTFADYLQHHQTPNELHQLVPGSWVYGDFSTWIGHADKNAGWELLCKAKKAYDQAIANGNLTEAQQQQALEQLAICESSDWFWWFGDYNAAESVRDFDQLYRTHLKNLYQILELPVPSNLDAVISVGHGNPENDGVMRRAN